MAADLVNNWADLPHHLLDLISDMIDSLDNLACFGSVCSSWRCVYIENLKRRQGILKFPLLMINNPPPPPPLLPATATAEEEEAQRRVVGKQEEDKENVEEEEEAQRRVVYSVATNNINIPNNLRLQVPHNMFCVGSSNGWLVTVPTHDDQVIYPVALLNPFLSSPNNEIQLPSLQMLPPDPKYGGSIDAWFTLDKVVVSVNPSTNVDYTVMVIFGDNSELAYWKPGGGGPRWTAIQTVWILVHDVIFHGHKFFSVNHHGIVMACDVSSNQKFRMIESLPPGSVGSTKKYIIESSGYLFQVHRLVGDDDTQFGVDGGGEEDYNPNDQTHWTKEFHVFKMDCQIEQWDKEDDEGFKPGWIQVNSLDDRAFFIGHNASISRSSAEVAGVKPNCIYFTDDSAVVCFTTDKTIGTYDIGVYCVEDKRFERYNYPMVPNGAPIWVEPTLGELKTLLKQI